MSTVNVVQEPKTPRYYDRLVKGFLVESPKYLELWKRNLSEKGDDHSRMLVEAGERFLARDK